MNNNYILTSGHLLMHWPLWAQYNLVQVFFDSRSNILSSGISATKTYRGSARVASLPINLFFYIHLELWSGVFLQPMRWRCRGTASYPIGVSVTQSLSGAKKQKLCNTSLAGSNTFGTKRRGSDLLLWVSTQEVGTEFRSATARQPWH